MPGQAYASGQGFIHSSYPLTLIEFLCAAASLSFVIFLASPLIGLTLAVLWSSYPATGLPYGPYWLSLCIA